LTGKTLLVFCGGFGWENSPVFPNILRQLQTHPNLTQIDKSKGLISHEMKEIKISRKTIGKNFLSKRENFSIPIDMSFNFVLFKVFPIFHK
jgi:hypothetical protein